MIEEAGSKAQRKWQTLRVVRSGGVLATLLLAAYGPFGPSEVAAAPGEAPLAATVTVQVGPNSSTSFAPATVTIQPGDTVSWVWSSTVVPHDVTSGTCSGLTCTADGRFTSGAPQVAPATFNRTFSTPGTFPYFCTVHLSAMTGTVVVQQAAATATSTTVPATATRTPTTATATPIVPEGSPLWLFGSGVLGLGWLVSRRRRRR
jgi:plastocyanin